MISEKDRLLAASIIGELREPGRRITHDGKLWFARWYLARTDQVNVLFHIQVASDPPWLHSHPWDNTSVYLAGEVDEQISATTYRPIPQTTFIDPRRPGAVVHREAGWSHRLELKSPYAMTMFMTGPMYRHWGFWRDGASPPNGLL